MALGQPLFARTLDARMRLSLDSPSNLVMAVRIRGSTCVDCRIICPKNCQVKKRRE